jgi:large subunit ribosomal protein L18
MVKKDNSRQKRHLRIRQKIRGNSVRPRLAVFKSNQHIYAQIIDDMNQKTLVAASSLSPELKSDQPRGNNVKNAQAVGDLIAKKAIAKNIKFVVFDRGGFCYHGRIKALAEAARTAGLKF